MGKIGVDADKHVLKNILRVLGEENMDHFNALSFYDKYTDVMDIDAVPEAERRSVARHVANEVLLALLERELAVA